MDFMDATGSLTYESGPLTYVDFIPSDKPVWILGKQYSTLYDLNELRQEIRSRIWITYRKGFSSIGGQGPMSDMGWGCMLRCGQMMLAQALVCRHLGQDWMWDPRTDDEDYFKILKMFLDKKNCYYSIHQIASMGVCEGKAVGNWFGPNTIAQVLKKLAVYDEWSSLVIHVAMDNTVIEDDIKTLCRYPIENEKLPLTNKLHNSPNRTRRNNTQDAGITDINGTELGSWRPLLLFIPLRLGLSEMNTVYVDSLKASLSLSQSVGIIGGKPNHAHWFIGYVGEELIYLDPHTTQTAVGDLNVEGDESYHCAHASRMKIHQLDPSIALGFYCGSEAEFNDLCKSIRKFMIQPNRTPMFEIHQTRPHHWQPLDTEESLGATSADFLTIDDRIYDSEEEFEFLG